MSLKVYDTYLQALKSKQSRLGIGLQNQQNAINSNLALTNEYMADQFSGARTGNASASARYAMQERALQTTQNNMNRAYTDLYGNYNKDIGQVLDEEARVQALREQQAEAERKAKEQQKTGLLRLGATVGLTALGGLAGGGLFGAAFGKSIGGIAGGLGIGSALSNIFGGALSTDAHGNPQIDINKMDLNQIGTGIGEMAYGVSNIVSEKNLKNMAMETGKIDPNKIISKFGGDPNAYAFWNAERDRLLRSGDIEAYRNFISEFYKDVPDVSGWQPDYQPIPTFGG